MSRTPDGQRWILALPWLVGAISIGPLVPLLLLGVPFAIEETLVNVPTSVGLLLLSLDCAHRAEARGSISPVRLAAVVGGALSLTALLAIAFVLASSERDMPILGIVLLMLTPFAMPPAALLGAGLGAGIVWLQQRPLS